jgi:hypothetical protein
MTLGSWFYIPPRFCVVKHLFLGVAKNVANLRRFCDVVQFIDSPTNLIQLDQMLFSIQQSSVSSTEEDGMIIFSQDLQ